MPDMWTESPTHLVRPVAVRRDLLRDLRIAREAAHATVRQIADAGDPELVKLCPPFDWRRDAPELVDDDCPPCGILRPGRFSTVWDDAS